MKAWVVLIICLGLIFAPLGLWLYAHVSTCGWKGIFVECRITEVK